MCPLTFAKLVLNYYVIVLASRSRWRSLLQARHSPKHAFRWIVGGALVFLAAVIYVPLSRSAFRSTPLHPVDLAICVAAGAASFLSIELLKLKRR